MTVSQLVGDLNLIINILTRLLYLYQSDLIEVDNLKKSENYSQLFRVILNPKTLEKDCNKGDFLLLLLLLKLKGF